MIGSRAHAQQAPAFSGEFKSLLVGSRDAMPPHDRYTLGLNRLRLALKGPISDKLSVDLQYDNELLLGSHLRTGEFRFAKDRDPPTYWRAQSNYVERARVHGVHRLHRASLAASFGDTDVRIGRQRIAWGTGRFWSPLDMLNPPSPTALDREERLGVDAVLVEHKRGPLSRVAFVVAPQHETRDASVAALWHDNRGGVDYSLVAGRFRLDKVVGVDMAGQLGSTGVRAEITRAWGPARGIRALLGVDHAFANTLTVSAELFHDGAGAIDRRNRAGVSLRFDITPMWKARLDVVANLEDGSRYMGPSLTWSVRENVDLTLGAQHFGGKAASEMAETPDLGYLRLQWFF